MSEYASCPTELLRDLGYTVPLLPEYRSYGRSCAVGRHQSVAGCPSNVVLAVLPSASDEGDGSHHLRRSNWNSNRGVVFERSIDSAGVVRSGRTHGRNDCRTYRGGTDYSGDRVLI